MDMLHCFALRSRKCSGWQFSTLARKGCHAHCRQWAQALLALAVVMADGTWLTATALAKQASGDWSTPGLAQPDEMQQRFFKLDNGTKVQQLADGKGRQAVAGDRVLFDYVLRRSNGYFIYSCVPHWTVLWGSSLDMQVLLRYACAREA